MPFVTGNGTDLVNSREPSRSHLLARRCGRDRKSTIIQAIVDSYYKASKLGASFFYSRDDSDCSEVERTELLRHRCWRGWIGSKARKSEARAASLEPWPISGDPLRTKITLDSAPLEKE